jgi:hypothetical protein
MCVRRRNCTAKIRTVPQCEVPTAALSVVRNAYSSPLQIFVGVASAVMFGIRFGAQGVSLHATSSGKLPCARTVAKYLHTRPGMPLSRSFAEKGKQRAGN